MEDRKRTIDFWFCKVHFVKSLFEDYDLTIGKFVQELINAEGNPYYKNNVVWRLGGLKNERVNGRNILLGKIGKESTNRNKVIYDAYQRDFIDTDSDENTANYCYFIVDIDSYIIAIQAQPNIALKTVQKRMIDLLPQEFRYMNFENLLDKFEVYKRIASWDRFVYADFKLRPTNPDSDDDFEQLDNLIRGTNADAAHITFTAKTDNHSLSTDDSLVKQGIAMSSAGYGEFKVEGVKDGEPDKLSSKTTHLKKAFYTDNETMEKKVLEYIDKIKKAEEDE